MMAEFESVNLTNRPNPNLSVYQCGYQVCKSNHSFGPFVRDHYLIHCVVKGWGTYKANGKAHKISEGQGFIIFPSETTTYAASTDDPWEYYWVGFNGSDAKRIIGMCGLSLKNLTFTLPDFTRTIQYLKSIYDVSQCSQAKEYAMLGYLYLFLSNLIIPQKEHVSTSSYLEKALWLIDQKYSYDISIAKIADMIGIDRSYLYKLFIEKYNISPKEYLLTKRIEKAKELLRNTDLSVSQVAYSVGFSDYCHFSKIFKQKEGTTPKIYNQQFHV